MRKKLYLNKSWGDLTCSSLTFVHTIFPDASSRIDGPPVAVRGLGLSKSTNSSLYNSKKDTDTFHLNSFPCLISFSFRRIKSSEMALGTIP